MRFQIEVRPRVSGAGLFVARLQVDAETEESAIEQAKRQFLANDPNKDVADYTFSAVKIE